MVNKMRLYSVCNSFNVLLIYGIKYYEFKSCYTFYMLSKHNMGYIHMAMKRRKLIHSVSETSNSSLETKNRIPFVVSFFPWHSYRWLMNSLMTCMFTSPVVMVLHDTGRRVTHYTPPPPRPLLELWTFRFAWSLFFWWHIYMCRYGWYVHALTINNNAPRYWLPFRNDRVKIKLNLRIVKERHITLHSIINVWKAVIVTAIKVLLKALFNLCGLWCLP